VGRTRWHGMSSAAILEHDGDQQLISSLMRRGGRSDPRARPTSIRHVQQSRSCSIGQRNRLWPMRSSPSCPVRCQLSSAATHISNGMSMIRPNDSQLAAEHMPALMLARGPVSQMRRVWQSAAGAAAPAGPCGQPRRRPAGCPAVHAPARRGRLGKSLVAPVEKVICTALAAWPSLRGPSAVRHPQPALVAGIPRGALAATGFRVTALCMHVQESPARPGSTSGLFPNLAGRSSPQNCCGRPHPSAFLSWPARVEWRMCWLSGRVS